MKFIESPALSIEVRGKTLSLVKVCPRCSQSGHHYTRYADCNLSEQEWCILSECTACNGFFITTYHFHYGQIGEFAITGVYPPPTHKINLPLDLEKTYPKFYEIYRQAHEAESLGLTEITGVGYRKALEFLVKDFCIWQAPAEKDTIEKEILGISVKRIVEPKLQALAKGATWIGNDETHYVRKHDSYNVQDMKKYIFALLHLMIAYYVADDADILLQS